jgi:ferredoxin-NADP reductase
MAEAKIARVTHTEKWQHDTCHIQCEMVEPAELGFTGGQYIIVNSGQLLPNGKLGKRAYSIVSSDSNQRYFELVVKKIDQGVGSHFIHGLRPGDTFEFSGPWGKFKPEGLTPADRILCIATDTGITASLGLLRGQMMQPLIQNVRLLWFVSCPTYFLSPEVVRAWLPRGLSAHLSIIFSTAVADSSSVLSVIDPLLQEREYTRFYLSGNGEILRDFKACLLEKGWAEDQILSESFFNHERLKSGV